MTTLATPSRRRFLFGAAAILAAPAIVRVAQLMPISVPERRWTGFTADELRNITDEMLDRMWADGVTFRETGLRALLLDNPGPAVAGIDRHDYVRYSWPP